MTHCEEVLEHLSDYLDEELPPGMHEDIARHLQGCQSCEDAAAGLLHSIEACRKYDSGERPGQLPDQVKAELKQAYHRVQAAMKARRDANTGAATS